MKPLIFKNDETGRAAIVVDRSDWGYLGGVVIDQPEFPSVPFIHLSRGEARQLARYLLKMTETKGKKR